MRRHRPPRLVPIRPPARRACHPRAGRLAALCATALAALALPALAAPTAPAASLKRPGKLRVESVGVHRIVLRWKERSRGEARYELGARADGDAEGTRRLRPDRSGARSRGLEAGTVYEHRVRACRRGRCSPWSAVARQATLLSPFNGPHPPLGCAVLPPGDELNRDVSAAPVDPDSAAIVARILSEGGDELHPDFGSNPEYGIPYAVVPAGQPQVPIRFTAYGDESDRGPYPIPPGMTVEGGDASDGDRHVLVVRRPAVEGGPCELFELYRAFFRGGRRAGWDADAGAVFDLGAPLPQRPAGWTSADAAGLPILPGLVTYEEVGSGVIDHAIRITFERTRRAYVDPATHFASDDCDPDLPAMGARLRLSASYDLSSMSGDARVIAEALKRYGAIVADNGSNWFISGSTDPRWDDEDLNQLKDVPGSAFEVVRPSTPALDGCS